MPPLWVLVLKLCSILYVVEGEQCYQNLMKLHGAGSSFPAPFYMEMGTGFASKRSVYQGPIDFNFDRVNSGYGKMRIKMESTSSSDPPVVFAGTESTLTPQDKEKYPNLITFPVLAGALVVIYKLPGITNLNLSIHHLTGIYTGNITTWSHPDIQKVNPNANLPNEQILPVARADSGGDTEIFTSALSSFSQEWAERYGVFMDPMFTDDECCNSTTWPPDVISFFGNRVTGMVGIIASIPFTLGYAALANAKGFGVSFASLVNRAGHTVNPDMENVQSAMDYHLETSDTLEFGLNDAPTPGAYPLASFSYMVVNRSTHPQITCCVMTEFVGFAHFLLFSTEKEMFEKYHLVPLSKNVASRVLENILSRITCEGDSVFDAYLRSLVKETSASLSQVTVFIAVSAVCIVALVLSLFFLKYRRDLRLQNDSYWLLDEATFTILESQPGKPDSKGSQWSFSVSKSDIHSSLSPSHRASSVAGSLSQAIQDLKFTTTIAKYEDELVELEAFLLPMPKGWKMGSKGKVFTFKQQVSHRNLLRFLGVVHINERTYLASEHLTKGTLHYVLQTSPYQLENTMKYGMAIDIADGLQFLHRKLITHGNLSSLTCIVDSTWCTKIGSWQGVSLMVEECPELLEQIFNGREENVADIPEASLIKLFYKDPLLKSAEDLSVHRDCFSMGMLLIEIFSRQHPYFTELEEGTATTCDLLENYRTPSIPPTVPESLHSLIRDLLSRNIADRPTIKTVRTILSQGRSSKQGIVDIMMQTMEKYTETLEEKVLDRTAKLRELLNEMLPPQIAEKLFQGESIPAEYFESVTVYFSDIVGFTTISSKSSPLEVMGFLNDLWLLFDKTIEQFDVYKVDTIGDAYMVCSGLPQMNGVKHVEQIALLSFALLKHCSKFRIKHMPNDRLLIRIGINSGPVTAGVVGSKMPQYCVFGDTVNTASRMESTSLPRQIQVSQATQDLLSQHFPQFKLRFRGEIEVKVQKAST